jgi:hypothetical protein
VRPDPATPVRVDIMGNGFLEVLGARDVSVGGLGISVPHDFAGCDTDSAVELIITLGRTRPFKTRGVIRHNTRAGADHVFGIQFTSLTPEQVQLIEAYVASRMAR